MSKKRKVLKVSLVIVNIILLLGLGFTSVFFFLKYHNLQNNNLTDDQKIAKYEKEIDKTYSLPSDEKPTLAVVKDAEATKKLNPTFLKDVKVDDVLLIFQKAPLVVVYRPSTKKIINSAPLTISNRVSVEVIGAKADRDSAAAIIKQAFANTLSVSAQVDAKTPITSTTVVDVTGKNAEAATKLATELKGKVGTTPDGQDTPAADVGIVVYAAPATSP